MRFKFVTAHYIFVNKVLTLLPASAQHRGPGRRHAPHRRLLSPAGHVRGQEPTVCLHPLQSGESAL